MAQSPHTYSDPPGVIGRADWFDFAPLLGGAPLQALLSQRNGSNTRVSLAGQRDALARRLGIPPERIAVPCQVHDRQVALALPGRVHPATDGLFTNDPRVVLSLQVADCAPVFFYHPGSRFRGLVHAGWRGVAAGVLTAGTDFLRAQGVDLHQVEVVIGPTIEPACYEVGPEVVDLFPPTVWAANSNPSGRPPRDRAGGRYQLDLAAAAREQLIGAGVRAGKITGVPVCTRCDPRCHSYRRDGKRAGRMVAFYYEQP